MNALDEQKLSQLSPFEIKNTLLTLASSQSDIALIDAGRGNPNWVATLPREAFFQLGLFALSEANLKFKNYDNFGGTADKLGIFQRLQQFCFKTENQNNHGLTFLLNAIDYLKTNQAINPDEIVFEWTNGVLGDDYPVPDRMLKHAECIIQQYLSSALCDNQNTLPQSPFDLFAVEGGTAAIVYIFNTLKSNRLLCAGDSIAIATPIFTPYIEIPDLEDYALNRIEIEASEDLIWQISDTELNKLLDPNIRAFFVTNPSNPPSVKLSDETLTKIANIVKQRPDLIIITDDVYGTFADNFTSLAMIVPHNTILVYSFSKYFGATGWRLGVIGIQPDNILDELLRKQSNEVKHTLFERYKNINLDPNSMKFIDRLVSDSRAVALNHTAGLSTPQQIQMSLFAVFSLMDNEQQYKQDAKNIIRDRYHHLMEHMKGTPVVAEDNPNGVFYYVEIDIARIANELYGEKFLTWLTKTYNALDFVVRLAQENAIIVMLGAGFDAPQWSIRISLANLDNEKYDTLMDNINNMVMSYHDEFNG
ncbi:bifunctional aspartate transaminase/aspartate 4-decarboxylase [Photobacterium sp. GB-3]|uniref:bifunctional aspartate transaminase/aspartate 4-decarboxylase n=1 Tax=Photobacterium sp. GB-3 TaxID=2022110 RepID=UPI000D157506|nr:bifunctional aspartate transaminase/aspartate 4-decarboxylase [Photobacterium sp. GB-3]PSV54317.1 aspartate 4-decarboxylase [Photobacterium sp. GB-3]